MKKNKKFIISMIIVFGLNATMYFLTKLFVSNYHIISSPIDDKIPFLMGFIWIYMIWYPFLIVSLYYIFKYDKEKYSRAIASIVICAVISWIFFLAYPTMVNRPVVDDYNSITSFVTFVVFRADTPVNCFPSEHCILCFVISFASLFAKNMPKRTKIIINVLSILIVASTLFTKQHVFVDAVGALVISVIVYYIISKIPKIKDTTYKLIK